MVDTQEFSVVYPTPNLHKFPAPTKESPSSFPAPDSLFLAPEPQEGENEIFHLSKDGSSVCGMSSPKIYQPKICKHYGDISLEGSDPESASLQVAIIQQVPFLTLRTSAAKLCQPKFSPVFVGGWHPQFKQLTAWPGFSSNTDLPQYLGKTTLETARKDQTMRENYLWTEPSSDFAH